MEEFAYIFSFATPACFALLLSRSPVQIRWKKGPKNISPLQVHAPNLTFAGRCTGALFPWLHLSAVPSQLRGYSATRTQFGISYHAQSMPADAIFVTCHLSHLNVDSVNLTLPVKAPSSLNPIHFSVFLSPPWHPGFCPDSTACADVLWILDIYQFHLTFRFQIQSKESK